MSFIKNVESKKQITFFRRDSIFEFPYLLTVILLLISSPSYSIFKGLGGFYFPNEKLAFLLAMGFTALNFKIDKMLKENKVFWICGSLIALFVLARGMIWGEPHFRDLNFALTLVSIPTFLWFICQFSKRSILKSGALVLGIHLSIACIQLIFVSLGEEELAMFFHNHPMQKNYFFSWRVAGLFMESSQFASFLTLMIFLLYRNRSYLIYNILICWSLLIFFANFSITGYTIFTLFLILESWRTRRFLFVLLILLTLDFFTLGVFRNMVLQLYDKIYITFFSPEEVVGEVRFIYSIEALYAWSSNLCNVLFGVENREISQLGDIFSYNLYRYGIVGFSAVIFLYYKVYGRVRKEMILFTPLLLTCAPIMQPVQILFLIILSNPKNILNYPVKVSKDIASQSL
ncbi:MAG: hypothetical protein NXH75_02270 [Halobacteriovoraceae bacterium]|nr:hypothetical protein [Halobacteriovoraceae bacterium]